MARPLIDSTDLRIAARGFLMGGADIIPGVSGGTIALIVGIYERLVTSISRFDTHWLALLSKKDWRTAAQYVDMRFLVALAAGILFGIVSLASLMHHLLDQYRAFTLAAFFGLVLGSSILVGRMVQPKSSTQGWICLTLGTLGATLALAIVLQPAAMPQTGYAYTFLCGMVAICAMILPGISGAYILVLLGKYAEITGIIKQVPRLQASATDLIELAVFAAGCLIGLVAFSKFLRWLLLHWHAQTMALLCGIMVGSLYRIWPIQQDMTPFIDDMKHKLFRPHFPPEMNSDVILCAAIAGLAFAAVLALERIAGKKMTAAGT